MKWREEDYDQVHDQIISNLQEEYEKFGEAIKTPYYDSDQKDIARAKMRQIKKRADKIRS